VAKHVTLINKDAPETVRTFALPITTILDHSSKTQRNDWIRVIRAIFSVYDSVFEKDITAQTWRDFVAKIKGMSTDHANDQKLLIQLLTAWKSEIDRQVRGEAALKTKSAVEVLQLIHAQLCRDRGESETTEEEWNSLPNDEQARLVSEAWRTVCLPFGEEAYHDLSAEEQAEVDGFVWAGCCMHKGLNAGKGGFDAMTKAWASIPDAVPPVKMVTKDNRATLEKASDEESERIHGLSKGGAAKLTELMGALLKNKDDKKGQQDSYKLEFLVRLVLSSSLSLSHIHLASDRVTALVS
jgi:hypothetical protein